MNNINISQLKKSWIERYPDSKLTNILSSTPDELSAETFLALVRIWLILVKEENDKNKGGNRI